MSAATPPGGYRAVRVQIENIKRVRFAEIDAEGNLIVIAGKNGAGKTTILDALMWAFAGGRSFTDVERPIRDGAKKGRIEVDVTGPTGSYKIVRSFTAKTNNLDLFDQDGNEVKNPQAVLSALIGEHSFDPFGFMRLPKRDQRATLLNVVKIDVDLDALAAEREQHYADRTATGRIRDRLQAQYDATTPPAEGLPTEEQSAGSIGDELRVAIETNEAAGQLRRDAINAEGAVEQRDVDIENIGELIDKTALAIRELTDQLARHEKVKANLIASREGLVAQAATLRDEADQAELIDLDPIRARLDGVERINRQIRAARDRDALGADLERQRDEYDGHTRAIEDIDEQKVAALQRANMPIPGLTFDDEGLYYEPDGAEKPIPINQCSDSEQLRISVALAVALNPHLRMARIKEGSLLDRDSLLLLRELADTHNFQLWVEMVAETAGDDDWIMLADGAVVEGEEA